MDWWFSPNMFRVYIDSGYQTLIGDFDLNSMQTIATEIRITSNTHALAMTPSTTLYFRAYRNNMNQGSASATAEQLLDPNFVLAFN